MVPDYRELAKVADKNFQGLSVLNHVVSIRKLAHEVGAKTMLDFGCGRGDAYRSPHKLHHQIGLSREDVTLYDPAFRPTAVLPTGTYDLVVCSDVLEHIPEHEVDEFVARLFSYAKKAVWASVCCRPAKKCFPDGRNLHVTVQPYEWWSEKFDQQSGADFVLVETP
jgi:2-polyprenyl-3-methyl-5-hydroxy-6-metoxy-1,4-benzoquinol methylase